MKMLCSRCHKRRAVVFITRLEKDETVNEGLCLQCARELGIKPISQMLENMGISDENLEEISDQFDEMLGGEEGDSDGFEPGGAASMNLFSKLMQGLSAQGFQPGKKEPASENEQEEKNTKKPRGEKIPKKQPADRKYLNAYCQDLTAKAREGKIDTVVGRDQEILRVLQILNRRTKNNPCLIGEPGVGKTAIAEGIALRIVQNKVPAKIAEKEIWLLDLTALVAGTQFRGQFESRIRGLIDEVRRCGNIILVIDEVHNLVAAGDAEGAMNAANMLKPALSRGEIQVIGATTLTEYRKYIEKDSALERRFQPVMVNEPSVEQTVEILRGVKGYYESFHGISIPGFLLSRAVELSERYVTDRYLPDKAIDLIDEAASNATLKNPVYEQLFLCRKEIERLKKSLEELENREAPSEEDYAAIAAAKAELCRREEQLEDLEQQRQKAAVTLEDLALVIELWTGIPASKIQEAEHGKLAVFGDVLRRHIVGQDKAVDAVTAAIRRSRVALVPRKRPVSFIFTGPTGVGKTELVKVLARELFDSPETLIRLDMSEFMEKHAVSRIIGAPPGYVGYDEAGQLTEKIRRKPYSVILFDEIEKAHPDVLNVLLQILDDGRVTDAHGRTVSFEHTIIVMTSNAGSGTKGTAAGFNRTPEELSADKAKKALSEFLRPEFLNRVDEIITFSPLPKSVFPDIVRISLRELSEGLAEREIRFSCTEEAVALLVDLSYSAEYGARNVRRVIQREIEDKAVAVLCETFAAPKGICVGVKDGQTDVQVELQ